MPQVIGFHCLLHAANVGNSEQKLEENIMRNFREALNHLLRDDSGQDLIEYALVAALIGLGATAAMSSLASTIGSAFGSIGSELTSSI
jgi:pilus assembly protein Flp/PilA